MLSSLTQLSGVSACQASFLESKPYKCLKQLLIRKPLLHGRLMAAFKLATLMSDMYLHSRVQVLQVTGAGCDQTCRYCRALGDADYKDPKPFVSAEASVRRLDLLPEDKAVIIASDGLWDVIGDQDVVSMVDQLIKVKALTLHTFTFCHTTSCLETSFKKTCSVLVPLLTV